MEQLCVSKNKFIAYFSKMKQETKMTLLGNF